RPPPRPEAATPPPAWFPPPPWRTPARFSFLTPPPPAIPRCRPPRVSPFSPPLVPADNAPDQPAHSEFRPPEVQSPLWRSGGAGASPTDRRWTMTRKLVLRASGPAILIGVLLLAACLVGAWYIDRLQRDLAKLLSREVASLQESQELEIRVRQLRFHSFLNLVDPNHAREEPIRLAKKNVQESLGRALRVAHTAEERARVDAIRDGYQRYELELTQLPTELKRLGRDPDLHKLADGHPVRHVVAPC